MANHLNRKILIKEYSEAKKLGKHALSKGNINKAISHCQFAGYLPWMYPFLEKFSDDDLENTISQIAQRFNKIHYTPIDNRLVFYNSQIIDSGALTDQYLDYFIGAGFSVLFIVPDIENTKMGQNILKKIEKSKKIELFIPKTGKSQNKINQIRNRIDLFQPSFGFLHFIPNDVVACASFSNISSIKTFYIVHNDHTFWLGKKYFDYFIEFRHFGISLAVERRGIPKDQILHIPYYPIKTFNSFNGFPFDRSNKIVGVSGANLYKYLVDPELKYFEAIKVLLDENPDFVFCLTGRGDIKRINEFILKNNLNERFFCLGHRDDFYSLIGQCDILFESYPLKGGLVPLFATEQKMPIVGIATYDNFSGSLEELLDISNYKQPANFAEFKSEATRLIRDSEYRKYLGLTLSKNRCNKKDFESALTKIMNNDLEGLKPSLIEPLRLNDKAYLREYLNLSDATHENLIRQKLFVMKSSLSIFERVKLFVPALKAHTTIGFKGFLRILILVILGK